MERPFCPRQTRSWATGPTLRRPRERPVPQHGCPWRRGHSLAALFETGGHPASLRSDSMPLNANAALGPQRSTPSLRPAMAFGSPTLAGVDDQAPNMATLGSPYFELEENAIDPSVTAITAVSPELASERPYCSTLVPSPTVSPSTLRFAQLVGVLGSPFAKFGTRLQLGGADDLTTRPSLAASSIQGAFSCSHNTLLCLCHHQIPLSYRPSSVSSQCAHGRRARGRSVRPSLGFVLGSEGSKRASIANAFALPMQAPGYTQPDVTTPCRGPLRRPALRSRKAARV